MVVKCKKSRKHKPKKVMEPVLEIEHIPSTLFADSEVKERSFQRDSTENVRQSLTGICKNL